MEHLARQARHPRRNRRTALSAATAPRPPRAARYWRRAPDSSASSVCRSAELRGFRVRGSGDPARRRLDDRGNFRLYPTPGQQQSLSRAFGCARVVFNDALAARKGAFESGQYITDAELSRALTRMKNSPERAWLCDVSSVVLQQALADLNTELCSRCGMASGKKPLEVRVWICGCGAVLDRDRNAAINILAAGQAERQNACGV
ncbi:helix-turn-helix domain-containing protein [Nocardia sp. NPDC049526]|uniref:helix-turn-helix domain-containing protein n=1 Tax=Nocardia sp. NPDC049526 TaxID=3364316 RepID=UPI00378DE124